MTARATAGVDDLQPSRQAPGRRTATLALAAAAMAGLLAALAGPVIALLAAALGLLAFTAWRPVTATYVYLGTLPFIAGIQRGTLIPLVRPNEALLVLLIAGACAGGYARFLTGRPLALRLHPLDLPLATFAVLATLWPIVSLMLRGATPTGTELVAVFPMVKLVGLILLVRATVRTASQLRRCVRLVIWTAGALAGIAVLQTLGVPPVLSFLGTWWGIDPGLPESSARGSATLGHSIATGDYIVIGLGLLISAAVRGLIGRKEGLLLGFVLATGVLASGQFSTWLAALVAGGIVLHRIPQARRRATRVVPVAALALVVGAPAVLSRLQGIGGELGVPQSWLVRWDNVTYLYLPPLFEDRGFVIGVSPDSVLTAPDIWRDVIWIESGYLQFLWMGGLPLLAGFVWLSVAVLRHARALSRRPDALGACGSCLEIAWGVLIVVSAFDPHIFLRGTGDILFALVALTTGRLLDDGRVRGPTTPRAGSGNYSSHDHRTRGSLLAAGSSPVTER
ncbi:hypothetical protein [Blastococcus mobilis]|uniref:O-antigen ligase n=1 Tax=Blastococcus mobilis TaxID=1938746 RepID=A0A238Z280_9ACTN|nr:hypothetical protein [Blastococcus mobilis]SNR77487.1 hypothetical protein SAMN06272737_12453 [Blastococcus mobilis]